MIRPRPVVPVVLILTVIIAALLFYCHHEFAAGSKEEQFPKSTFFPVDPHVILRAYHRMEGEGFHRRYLLDLEMESHASSLDLSQCELLLRWQVPKEAFVDPYELARDAKYRWKLDDALDKIDLEAPSHSPKALPFSLGVSLPAESVSVEIDNLLLRYQLPNSEAAFFPKPTFDLTCPSDVTMIVAEMGLEPIPLKVPVPWPTPIYGQATFLCLLFALLLLLLVILLKVK